MKMETVKARNNEAPSGVQKRILVCLDFATNSNQLLAYAAKLAQAEQAAVCLLHIVDCGTFKSDLQDSPGFHTETHIINRAKRYLRFLARRHFSRQKPIRIMVRSGKTTRETVKVATEICADLIILPPPPRSSLLAWLTGDPVRWIESHAPCSVIVFRPHSYGQCECSDMFKPIPAQSALT